VLKALTGELVNEVAYSCQQFHGGMGYMRESRSSGWCAMPRVLAIGGGAPSNARGGGQTMGRLRPSVANPLA